MNPYYPREAWDPFDPMLLSEGAFAAGMIFSFLKLVHIFSVNPHLGPLQISLGRMIIDILKFFFIYTLVLFAFGCGKTALLYFYVNTEYRGDGGNLLFRSVSIDGAHLKLREMILETGNMEYSYIFFPIQA